MIMQSIKGYVLVVLSGLVILAAALLIILQWGNPAEFSLYGRNYSIHLQDAKATGGVNTGLLMLCSAAGGVLLVRMGKMMVHGVIALRRARRAARQRAGSSRAPAEGSQR